MAVELKQSEIALKELEHNQKVADKSIDAQAEDRKDERRTSLKRTNAYLLFGGVALVLLLGFSVYALHVGKEAILLDVLKVLMGFVGGWGASALWGNRKLPDTDE